MEMSHYTYLTPFKVGTFTHTLENANWEIEWNYWYVYWASTEYLILGY